MKRDKKLTRGLLFCNLAKIGGKKAENLVHFMNRRDAKRA
jgi:hypothetical protein